MMKTHITLLLCGLALGLSGCAKAKEQLGLERSAPDEFAVVKRAPLAMPPSYALRPPRPGAPRPQEQATSEQAKQVVFGDSVSGGEYRPSGGEDLLLYQAGTGEADPNIRNKVDSETSQLHDRNKPVAEKLFGIGGDSDEPSASVVDAKEEAERLRKNVDEGKPVTEGETPSIEE